MFKSIRELLSTRSFKNVFSLTAATVGAQLIFVVASPLLTRIYTPAEFGLLAVFSSMLGVLTVISSARYEMAIPLCKTVRSAVGVLSISLRINLLFSLAVLLLLVLFREKWLNIPGANELGMYLFLLPLALFFLGTYRALTYWAIRQKAFGRIARTKVDQSLSNVTVQLALGYASFGAIGLIIGVLSGQLFGIRRLMSDLNFSYLFHRNNKSKAHRLLLVKKYSRFPKYDVSSALINALSTELPQLLFGILFTPAVAGYYLLAQRVLASPLNLVSQSITQVLYGDISSSIRTGQVFNVLSKVMGTLVVLVSVPCGVVFIFGDVIFSSIFGPDWSQAGYFASILIIGISAQFVYSPASSILVATNGQHINLIVNIVLLLVRGGALYYGWLEADPLIAVIGFSMASCIIYLFCTALVLVRTKYFVKHQR